MAVSSSRPDRAAAVLHTRRDPHPRSRAEVVVLQTGYPAPPSTLADTPSLRARRKRRGARAGKADRPTAYRWTNTSRARLTATPNLASSTSRGGSAVRYSRHMDPACLQLQQLDLLLPLPGAQDQPQRRLLALPALVPVQPAQVQLDLALVGGAERAELQLDDDQPAKPAMEEEQIDVEVLVISMFASDPAGDDDLDQDAITGGAGDPWNPLGTGFVSARISSTIASSSWLPCVMTRRGSTSRSRTRAMGPFPRPGSTGWRRAGRSVDEPDDTPKTEGSGPRALRIDHSA